MKSAGPGGALTAIAAQPQVLVTIPITNLSDVTAAGVALDLNAIVAIEGVATPLNTFTGGSLNSFLQDETDGIAMFRAGTPDVTQGHLFVVKGPVGQFNGLTQIDVWPAVMSSTLAPARCRPSGQNHCATAGRAGDFEGQLVRIVNVNLTAGTWPAAKADRPPDDQRWRQPDPAHRPRHQPGWFCPTNRSLSVTGILSQFDSSSPFTSSYQLLPRNTSDIVAGPTASVLTCTDTSLTITPINVIQGSGTPALL